mmetsp:Transcript_106222/g.167734  ORF Transcript_106222/g.167734 Transcript_106222/m.167734 type:complete len:256 (-) Transcript_106222:88-855(-)
METDPLRTLACRVLGFRLRARKARAVAKFFTEANPVTPRQPVFAPDLLNAGTRIANRGRTIGTVAMRPSCGYSTASSIFGVSSHWIHTQAEKTLRYLGSNRLQQTHRFYATLDSFANQHKFSFEVVHAAKAPSENPIRNQCLDFELDGPRRSYVISASEPTECEEEGLRKFIEERLLSNFKKLVTQESGGQERDAVLAAVPLVRYEEEIVGQHGSYLGDNDRYAAYIGPLSQDQAQLVEKVLRKMMNTGDIVMSD